MKIESYLIYIFSILIIGLLFARLYLRIKHKKNKTFIIHALVEISDYQSFSSYYNYSKLFLWKNNNLKYFRFFTNKFVLFFIKYKLTEIDQKFVECYKNSEAEREAYNAKFIKEKLTHYADFFDKFEKFPLTMKQREAIITDEDNNLVVAGAGTGKTSTITAKAIYLIKYCNVKPEEILLLTFTKKAANEIAERVFAKTDFNLDVKTFHKLGFDIIKETKTPVPNLAFNDEAYKIQFINNQLKELFENKEYLTKLTLFILNHYYDYSQIFQFTNTGKYFKYLKSLKSFDNNLFGSIEQLYISNILYLLDIKYVKNPDYKSNKDVNFKTKYKPIFYLPDYDLYIDTYPFINSDKELLPAFKLSNNSQSKIIAREIISDKTHYQQKSNRIVFYTYELYDDTFFATFVSKIKKYITINDNRLNSISQKLIKSNHLEPLISLIIKFINLFKAGFYKFEEIKTDDKFSKKRYLAFIDLVKPIYTKYQDYLTDNNLIDFNDMLLKSVELTESQKYKNKYNYILIDEFQDISFGRFRLIKALKDQNKTTKTFCVGDDWQSIFRFTGSDISIIVDFSKYFGFTKIIYLDTTFRFAKKLAEISEAFVLKNPLQLNKNLTTLKDDISIPIEYFTSSTFNKKDNINDILNQIFVKISNEVIGNKNVFLLGRYSFNCPLNIEEYKSIYHNLNIEFITVHSSKGLEADYIILLECNNGKYGFPSELSDDSLLSLLLKKSELYPHSEERRLFYVALTRTRNKVFIIYDKYNPSIFVEELLNINSLKNCPKCRGGKMQVRTNNKDNTQYYSCENYPLCRHSESINDI